jgi:hypothetical protein
MTFDLSLSFDLFFSLSTFDESVLRLGKLDHEIDEPPSHAMHDEHPIDATPRG